MPTDQHVGRMEALSQSNRAKYDYVGQEEWCAVRTASDGARALHAVWGAPRKTPEDYELYRDAVREEVLRRVPSMWHEIERRYRGALTAPFHEMIQSKFADVVDGTNDDETR